MFSRGEEMIMLEECERLKNNILSLNFGGTVKTIMITSSVNGEGCSTMALNLAETLAKNKTLNVLLIDGNLRHPTLHKFFDLENNAGLSDLILNRVSSADVFKRTRLPNLSIITSGDCNVNPDEIFESHKVRSFLAELKGRFNFLIFDSPPVNKYPDAHILAAQVDGVLLVVHAGKTRWEVAQKSKEQLEMAHANILGVVLNRRKYVIPRFLYKRL